MSRNKPVRPRDRGRQRKQRTWATKFRDAFLGLAQAIPTQSSFRAHFLIAAAVLLLGWYLDRFDTVRWCVIVLCIAAVLGAEMLNTSIETLAKAVTTEYDPLVGKALNVASGAVFIFASGAAVVGGTLFLEAILSPFR